MKLKTKAKTIRAAARKDLKGNWGPSIGVCVLMGIIVAITMFIVDHTFLHWIPFVQLVIVAPIGFGLTLYFLNRARGKEKFSDLFNPFTNKRWWKSIVLTIMLEIGGFITALLLIIVGAIATIGGSLYSNVKIHEALLNSSVSGGEVHGAFASIGFGVIVAIFIAIIVAILLLIPFYIYIFTYCMITPVALDNPDMGLFEVFKTSRLIMRGNKLRYFRLLWTYFWWILLCIITFGIGYLWIAPYMMTAQIKFYQEIIGEIDFSSGSEVKVAEVDEPIIDLEKNE